MARVDDLKNSLASRAGGQVQQQKPSAAHGIKALMASDAVKNRFNEVLKHKAPQFMASIINLVNSSQDLQAVDGMSVIQSAMVAAALDLPVDKNLGYMWIVPYKGQAQPQLGYKGFIQLALRTGQYKYINVVDVYEGELVSWNRLTEEIKLDFDAKKSESVIGYAAHFELINGFKKTVFWTKEQVKKHKERFSKTGMIWNSDFDAMGRKTVIKSMLSHWGILSIEMQRAFVDGDSEEREEVGEGSDFFNVTATTEVREGEIIEVENVSVKQVEAARKMIDENFRLLKITEPKKILAYIESKMGDVNIDSDYDQMRELLDIQAADIEKAMTGE